MPLYRNKSFLPTGPLFGLTFAGLPALRPGPAASGTPAAAGPLAVIIQRTGMDLIDSVPTALYDWMLDCRRQPGFRMDP